MADLHLSLVMGSNPRSEPVLSGAIKPEGIELTGTRMHPSEIFWRQLSFAEFDISEMSMSSYLIAFAGGNRDWVMLPVFTSRRFFHTGAWVRADAGIERPQDLKGKRVGVPEYQQTAALWSRGALKHEFDVDPSDFEWFMERTEDRSHGGATGFKPPAGVKFNRIPASENIGSMLVDGKLDATLLYLNDVNLVDRSRIVLEGDPRFRLLFPDPQAEGRRYFAKTGLYPINHGMVVRRSIYEKHPWVVLNIFNAFQQAKQGYLKRLRELAEGHVETGLLPPEAAAGLAKDPFPYGVKSNQRTLETIAAYSHEQGLTPRVMDLGEIFAPQTMDL
jgi:4,5-dihydroxyphthalate decarboxylase